MTRFQCQTCSADWSSGRWTWGCAECGGAAMLMPCEWCGDVCGGHFERAPMDSNDTGQAHFFGGCRKPNAQELLLTRYPRVLAFLRGRTSELKVIAADLQPFANDTAWERAPEGPPRLQVLRDACLETGLQVTPRALAHHVFG